MAEVNINLKCDLQHAVKVQYLDGNLFSQDAAANTINIEVTDGGAPAEIGGTVSANVIRPDGGTVAVTGGTIDGNIVSITLPAACYALVGMITIVVKLTDESTVTTLAAAVAYVYQSSTDTVVDPGTVVSSIQDLIDAIDTAVASIPADYSSLWTSLAPAFSSSMAYTAGQYVTYNGGLYRFTKAHAAGSWASGDVAAAKLGPDLTDLKSALDSICQTYPTLALNLVSGGFTTTTGKTDTNNKRIRSASNNTSTPIAQKGDFFYVSSEYLAKWLIYTSYQFTTGTYVGCADAFANGVITIPTQYAGKYVAILLKKVGHEDEDISADVETIGTKVFYFSSALGNRQTDKTLTLEDYPADAKETGNIAKYFWSLQNGYVTSIADDTDFNTLTTPGNYKVTSTASAATMPNIPYTGSGGRLIVSHVLSAERYMQIYFTSQDAIKMFIRFKGASSWSKWNQMAYNDEMDSVDNYIKEIIEQGSNQINLKYESGNINDGGGTSSDNLTRIRTASNSILTPAVAHGDYVWVDPAYEAKIALYNSRVYNTTNFVAFVSSSYQNGCIAIPDSRIGKYVGIVVRKVGYEDADISADIPIIQTKVRYIRPSTSRGYTDGERPVYVAFGASTTAGAVHDGGSITYTANNFPDYISSVLGLETYNLAVGSTGFLERYNGDNNIMDQIYANDAILSRAKLITIMFGYGNDNWVGSPSKYFSIGHYTDYYPYDEEGYHPTGTAGLNTMISKGATLMGCLNWCIKWISEKYPYAQLILIFGSPSANDDRWITMTAQTEGEGVAPYTLTFNEDPFKDNDDHYSAEYGIYLINEELKKLKKAMDIPIVNLFYEGNAFNWYSTYAKNPDDSSKYALFSTTADATSDTDAHEHWNSHPNEAGYLYYARLVAGKVISLFKH